MSKRDRDESDDAAKTSEELSLSVNDTNKLREKLGLKPLAEGDSSTQAEADMILDEERRIKDQEKVAEKIAKAKDKREYTKKSGKKGIAEEVEDEDMVTANWVKKMRKKQGKKPTAAEKQAAAFDDADEAEQVGAEYTANDLKGLKMMAKAEDFQEGKEVIMTLKDESILDGDGLRGYTGLRDGDALENVNFVEQETATKNNKLRGYNPGVSAYTGLDDHEWNADGSINTEAKGILSKYDAEIGGDVVAPSMTIGVETNEMQIQRVEKAKQDEIRGKIKENLNTMEFKKLQEQYTHVEMATFDKPKKKRKKDKSKKKKERINWDEEEEKAIGEDHGSRASRDYAKEQQRDVKIKDIKSKVAYQEALSKAQGNTTEAMERQFAVPVQEYDSEEEDDLGAALAKARQMKQARFGFTDLETMAGTIKEESTAEVKKEEEDAEAAADESEDEDKLVLDATSEFCKMVEVDEEKEDEEEDMMPKEEEMDVEDDDAPKENLDYDSDDSDDEKQEGFTKENLVSSGMGAALDFIRGRGSLNDTHEGVTGRFNDKVMEGEYVPNSDVDKETQKKLNSFTLEYRDKFGRKMSQKEAFRQLSYGFHGKGPGKSKIEARQRKYAEEQRLRKQGQNGAIDQPITLQALKVQQKGTRQAHMVIGGGAGGMRHD